MNSDNVEVPVSESVRDAVARLLGREPRGLRGVPVLDKDGQPAVIRVAPLVDGKPFPTLFWLVDPELCYRIDQAEASGLIQHFQEAPFLCWLICQLFLQVTGPTRQTIPTGHPSSTTT